MVAENGPAPSNGNGPDSSPHLRTLLHGLQAVAAGDISARLAAEAEMTRLNRELIDTSRQAGMAEVATGVLHNVGNVLNSINVASACMADSLKKSKAGSLSKVVALLREHEAGAKAADLCDECAGSMPGHAAARRGRKPKSAAA